MSWLIFTIICLCGWGFADLFYKKGADEGDKNSHLKQGVWVGIVMGAFAFCVILFNGDSFDIGTLFYDIAVYSPVSLCYILSMVIGYAGLRYLELSIISPIQNSSGAFAMILMLIIFAIKGTPVVFGEDINALDITGTALIIIAIIALSFVENSLSAREENIGLNKKYRYGAKALIFPILYCVFDAIGTAADGVVLSNKGLATLSEIDVLVVYGLTFFVAGIICYIIIWIKERRAYNPFCKSQVPKMAGAVCEEFGQVFYVFAMARNPVIAAPVVSGYCIFSVALSKIFLKEKLKKRQMACIILTIVGIILLGISEGINA